MAEESRELLLGINFEVEEALKRAANLRSAIDADKEAVAELNKVIKKGGELNQQQLVEREKLDKRIRENTTARRAELDQVNRHVQATKNAIDADGKYNGSITNLRGSLAFLTKQWNDLSKTERENTQVGGVLQKEIKRLSDELKTLEGSVGDNRRSVGGYLDAIRQAPGAMGKFRAGIDGISMAMKANPLGLIMSFLPQIQALFNSSGEGADNFAKIMSIVNAVIQEGLKRLVALGGAFFKVMIGDFKGAFEQGKAALTGFTSSVNAAIEAGGNLADQLDKLEVAESKFTVTSARTKKQIEELLIQARNRTTAESERLRLLQKAEKLEVELNRQALKLAKERLALIQAENKIKQSDEDEEQKRVNEQLARIAELESESANIQEKIQNRKDALLDAAREREKKRNEDFLKEQSKRAVEELKTFQTTLESFQEKRNKEKEEQTKFAKESQALIDQQFAHSEAVRKADQQQKDQSAQDDLNRQRALDAALNDLAGSTSMLLSALAEENSTFAEFEKGVTLFKIGLASAEAISKGIASSQDLPFPGNLIAMATTIATVTTNLLAAKKLISGDVPKAPKSKFAEGGIISGPSHTQGGVSIPGTGIEVEGGEAVISKRATAMFAPLLSALNVAGGGKPLAPSSYMAMGGLFPATMNAGSNGGVSIDYDLLARKMAEANRALPAPVVQPKAVIDFYNNQQTKIKSAGLGY